MEMSIKINECLQEGIIWEFYTILLRIHVVSLTCQNCLWILLLVYKLYLINQMKYTSEQFLFFEKIMIISM